VVSRTGGALLLSSLYVYLHAAVVVRDARLQELIERRSLRPALAGVVMIMLGGAGWFAMLPTSAQAALVGAPALNVLAGLVVATTAVVLALLYLGPYRNPGWLRSPGFAAALWIFGTIAFTAGEFIREAVRKPYIIYNTVFGNQVFPQEVPTMRRRGYLESGTWTKAYVAKRYPQLLADGRIDLARIDQLDRQARLDLGAVLFQYHCNDCHAERLGYSAVGPLVQGWSPKMIRRLIDDLHLARFTMPPWAGAPEEAELLATYLSSIAPPRPPGMEPPQATLEKR
jgi:mono/diheme cytochrome c family protein